MCNCACCLGFQFDDVNLYLQSRLHYFIHDFQIKSTLYLYKSCHQVGMGVHTSGGENVRGQNLFCGFEVRLVVGSSQAFNQDSGPELASDYFFLVPTS